MTLVLLNRSWLLYHPNLSTAIHHMGFKVFTAGRFRLLSSGIWHCGMWLVLTNILQEPWELLIRLHIHVQLWSFCLMILWEALKVDCVKKFAYPHWNVFSLASDILVNKFTQLHSPFYFIYEGRSFTFSLDNTTFWVISTLSTFLIL